MAIALLAHCPPSNVILHNSRLTMYRPLIFCVTISSTRLTHFFCPFQLAYACPFTVQRSLACTYYTHKCMIYLLYICLYILYTFIYYPRSVLFVNKATTINNIIIIDYCLENYLFFSLFSSPLLRVVNVLKLFINLRRPFLISCVMYVEHYDIIYVLCKYTWAILQRIRIKYANNQSQSYYTNM